LPVAKKCAPSTAPVVLKAQQEPQAPCEISTNIKRKTFLHMKEGKTNNRVASLELNMNTRI
jgi:hypothetical protein